MAAETKYLIGTDLDAMGTVEFRPDGGVGERPRPGEEARFAQTLEHLRDVHGDDKESLGWWLDRQSKLREAGDGFWVQKARPDGTFLHDEHMAADPYDDDMDDEDDSPTSPAPVKLGRSWADVCREVRVGPYRYAEEPAPNPGGVTPPGGPPPVPPATTPPGPLNTPTGPHPKTAVPGAPAWRQPFTFRDLMTGPPPERRIGTGKSPTFIYKLPDGRKFFGKWPSLIGPPGFEKFPRIYSPHEHDSELLANEIHRLMGTSFWHPIESINAPESMGTDSKLLISPFLPGGDHEAHMKHYRAQHQGPLIQREPEADRQFFEMNRRVPHPGQIGEAAYAADRVNAGDRHWNNYLWHPESGVRPIDFGEAIHPNWRNPRQWERLPRHEGLQTAGRYGDEEWGNVLVPRHVVENFVNSGPEIMQRVAEFAKKHHGGLQHVIGPFSQKRVLDTFKRMLAKDAATLARHPTGPLTLRQLGVMSLKEGRG